MCITYIPKRWCTAKRLVSGQDAFNVRGSQGTRAYIRIFFLNIIFILLRKLIWKVSKTYNDIKFCKEAKTIIVVDMWLNSLRVLCIPSAPGGFIKLDQIIIG